MDLPRLGKVLALFAVCGFCGCRHFESASASPDRSSNPSVRNNCASLLYDLLGDEKDVSKLLLIKRESGELDKLVTSISRSAGDGRKKLEQLAAADRTLDLRVLNLPSGEVATREAVSKTTAAQLLKLRGADFELKLLLTQVEALNYGSHLAKVAGEHESSSARAAEFQALSRQLNDHYERAVALLKARQQQHASR